MSIFMGLEYICAPLSKRALTVNIMFLILRALKHDDRYYARRIREIQGGFRAFPSFKIYDIIVDSLYCKLLTMGTY